jgi:hypothetical protein
VIDLILNFICSCRSSGIDLGNVVVFAAQQRHLALLKSLGVNSFFHRHLGEMPESSDTYGDFGFMRMMWFKAGRHLLCFSFDTYFGLVCT